MLKTTIEDQVQSQWSGGSTTQIAISPKGALYADRQFLWRVSSATVDLPESTFTPLPDYNRLTAILDGEEMDVHHEGQEPIRLKHYQVHFFDGGWPTTAKGRCTDFNLMLRKGKAEGGMAVMELGKETKPLAMPYPHAVVFCVKGQVTIKGREEDMALLETEAAFVGPEDKDPALQADGKTLVAIAYVSKL
jgi:environmental stress-induced protein Ves